MAAVIERQVCTARPTGAALGADIEGVDSRRALDPETVAAIKQAWGDHLVLRFRGQRLDDDELMRFSRPVRRTRTGRRSSPPHERRREPKWTRRGSLHHRSSRTSSRMARRSAQLGAYEAIWHTDMSYNRGAAHAPAPLYALEVPPSGRRHRLLPTCISPTRRLPETLRRQVEGRLCRHDAEPQQCRRIAPRL